MLLRLAERLRVRSQPVWASRLTPWLLVAVLVVVYSFAFPSLDRSLGLGGRAFCMIYVFLAALYWGFPGGLLTALLTVPLNIMLSRHAGLVVLPAGKLGPLAMVLAGALIGRLRDLNVQLGGELRQRARVEEELREYQQRLKGQVEERTGNLMRANQQLQQEVSERTRVEQALRESKERFRELADSLPQTVFEIDDDGSFRFVNRQAFAAFGYSQCDIDGDFDAFQMIAPEDRARSKENMRRILNGETLGASEYKALRKDGSTFPVTIYSSPIVRDDRPAGLRGIIIDITEHKRLEAHLLRSQKMESVGRLAGGLAHDFNNILTTVVGYSELWMAKLDPDEPLYGDFQEILKASERAANLVRQLLAFSRRQITEPKVVNLNEVLLEMDKMLRRLIGEDVELVTWPASDLGLVKADTGQVEQVIVNLAVNAREAMPKGGKLTLETSNVSFEKPFISQDVVVSSGDYVMLAVSDTGVGMTREIKEHIFDPFFTTKKEGKGTGLGLATCYGVVKQNAGIIWVDSEPDKGTTFKIYFPRVEKESEVSPKEGKKDHLLRGTETILLVEDDSSVRTIASRLLRQQAEVLANRHVVPIFKIISFHRQAPHFHIVSGPFMVCRWRAHKPD